LQPNIGSNNTEVEVKAPVLATATRTVDTTSNVVQSTQEITTQQTQSTFNLLTPQTITSVQQATVQKPTVESKQETTNIFIAQETSTIQSSPLYSLLPPQQPATTQISSYQPVTLNNDSNKLTVTENAKVPENTNTTTTTTLILLPPQQPTQQIIQQNVSSINVQPTQVSLFSSQPTIANITENNTTDTQKMLLDRSSPLFQTLENKAVETQNNTTIQTGPAVNRNAQNNEAAAGTDINRMALTPAGYNEYLNLALRDATFYVPKEIYRNQRVIDNARAMRQLASDRLHREMVEQQYTPR
jgi:hypothetical protein